MVFYKGELCYINPLPQENFHKVVYMGYKHQFTHTPYVLRAKVTRAGPFPPYYSHPQVHLQYAIVVVIVVVVVVVVVVVCGRPAVYSVVHCNGCCLWQTNCLQRGVLWLSVSVSVSVSVVRPCGTPAVPLPCVYGNCLQRNSLRCIYRRLVVCGSCLQCICSRLAVCSRLVVVELVVGSCV